MARPTFEQVKEKYKNAKIVNSAYYKKPFDITEYDFDSLHIDDKCIYIVHKENTKDDKSLFDCNKGFAEIVTYK